MTEQESPADDLGLGEVVAKAFSITASGFLPAVAPTSKPAELTAAFGIAQAIEPPYDPLQLATLYEKSSALRPCVEAMATNIDGHGHRLEPVINLDSSTADKAILDALTIERLARGEPDPPTPEEVASTRQQIERGMRLERFRLERFLDYCCADLSFLELRTRTRKDRETTGNGYWEVLRDAADEIAQLVHVPARTMRLRPVEAAWHDCPTPQKLSPILYETRNVKRRFRTFVQILYGGTSVGPQVYFKEFGDRRTMSSRTGHFYRSLDDLRASEPSSPPATEILHWLIYSSLGPYGVPRWIGAVRAVTGILFSEIVNESYFSSKGIPPFAILVSGGKLAQGADAEIRRVIEQQIKGIDNFHRILVIEAAPANSSSPARVRIELVPLAAAQQQDALFQNYERQNEQKVARQFRLPDLIRGASQEVNRAQAEAVLQFVEQQVFQPARVEFDEVMNRRILADMGIRFWRFASNSAAPKDPELLVELLTKLVHEGILTPGEGRPVAAEALNRELKEIDAAWTEQPLALTLAGVAGGAAAPALAAPDGSAAGAATPAPETVAQQLAGLRQQLEQQAATDYAEQYPVTKGSDGIVRLVLPSAVVDRWFVAEEQPA